MGIILDGAIIGGAVGVTSGFVGGYTLNEVATAMCGVRRESQEVGYGCAVGGGWGGAVGGAVVAGIASRVISDDLYHEIKK